MDDYHEEITKNILEYFNISDEQDFDLMEKIFLHYADDIGAFNKILQDSFIHNIKNSMWEGSINGVLFNILSSSPCSISVNRTIKNDDGDYMYPCNGKIYYRENFTVDVNTSNDESKIIDLNKLHENTEVVCNRNILSTNIFSYEEYIKYFSNNSYEEELVKLIKEVDPVNVPVNCQGSYYRIQKFLNTRPKPEYKINRTSVYYTMFLPDGTKMHILGFCCSWKNYFYVTMNDNQYAVYKLKV